VLYDIYKQTVVHIIDIDFLKRGSYKPPHSNMQYAGFNRRSPATFIYCCYFLVIHV